MTVVLTILLLIGSWVSAEDAPQVDTPLGKLQGRILTSKSGKEVKAFLGVPYAKPPVGQLRFQPPQRLEKWEGVKEATKAGPWCVQYMSWSPEHSLLGVEDCLTLNIYTHNVSGKAPILVHIHGGGFIVGNTGMYNQTHLLNEDIVFVDVNYRVGIFGFLSFENAEMPGNQGLKDQALALKWVQENIASFGGDPSQVTIFGESAGGASVYHHIVSPLSRGLFHRAISSSGSSYNVWALSPPGLAKRNAEKLMTLIGCPTRPEEGIPCALQKEANEIVAKLQNFAVYNSDPLLSFSPTLEEEGPGSFLVAPVSKWQHSPVPLLMGMSSAEGLMRSAELFKNLKDYQDKFDEIAPISLMYWASASNPTEVTKKIRQFYFNNDEITIDKFVNLTNLYSDAWFSSGIIDGANKHKGDVYFYYFDYITTLPLWFDVEEKFITGAVHCGDMFFLMDFNFPNISNVQFTEEQKMLSRRLVELYTTFVKSGEISLEGLEGDWKKWTAESNNYVHIGNSGFHSRKGLLEDRYNFWTNIDYKDRLDGGNSTSAQGML